MDAAIRPATVARFDVKLEIAIRHCTEADLDRLEWFGLFTEHREIIHMAFARQRLGEVDMLVADLNGFPVGQAWIDFRRTKADENATLWAVRVLPPLQRHGIGERLMRAAELVACERGETSLSLAVERSNPDARRFYERLGYRQIGTCENSYSYHTPDGHHREIPQSLFLMRKELAPSCAKNSEAGHA